MGDKFLINYQMLEMILLSSHLSPTREILVISKIVTLLFISRLIYQLRLIQLLEIFKTEYLRGFFRKINIIEDKIDETLEAILKLYLKINNEIMSICG